MSGIFAIFNLDGRHVGEGASRAVAASLAGVGHEDSKVYLDGPVAVGTSAREEAAVGWPHLLVGENCILVVDARLDNRLELQEKLGIREMPQAALTDARLILEAYARWGENCPCHLDGDFVFCLWDRLRRRMLVARDQLGIRVLYYYRSPRLFAIASAPKALLAMPSVPRKLCKEKVADWLVREHGQKLSFYQGIEYLRPGHCLSVKGDSFRSMCYWDPDLSRRVRYAKDEEYVEHFNVLFKRAVSSRLRGVSPVGAFMSGGLDSSSVAVEAADLLADRGERLAVFTHVPPKGFSGPEYEGYYNDETPLVQAICSRNGNMDLSFLRGEGKTPFEGIERFFAITSLPITAVSNRFWMEQGIDMARRMGIRLLLGGDRGNLTVSSDGRHRYLELARRGHWLALTRELRMGAEPSRMRVGSLLKHLVVAPLLPKSLWPLRDYLRSGDKAPAWSKNTPLGAELAKLVDIDARIEQYRKDAHPSGLVGDGRGVRLARLRHGMYTDGAAIMDAWRCAEGVSMSDPTGAVKVVEYCLSIPLEQYLSNGRSRWLIRRAMEGRLPHVVLNNTRRGRQSPDWYLRLSAIRRELGAELDRLERNSTARQCLNLKLMRTLMDHWPQRDWHRPEINSRYNMLLSHGFIMGRFIRWFEEG